MSGQNDNPDLVGVTQPIVHAPVALTKPEPVIVEDDEKHYYCAIPVATMHSKDGTPIVFRNGFYSTKVKSLKRYLDKEIDDNDGAGGRIRHCSEDEVKMIQVLRDPQAALKAEFKEKTEPELRMKLEREITAKLLGISEAELGDKSAQEFMAMKTSEARIAGVDNPLDALRNKLTEGGAVPSNVGGVTVTPLSASENFQRAMVGTDKINAGAAEGSASDSGNTGKE